MSEFITRTFQIPSSSQGAPFRVLEEGFGFEVLDGGRFGWRTQIEVSATEESQAIGDPDSLAIRSVRALAGDGIAARFKSLFVHGPASTVGDTIRLRIYKSRQVANALPRTQPPLRIGLYRDTITGVAQNTTVLVFPEGATIAPRAWQQGVAADPILYMDGWISGGVTFEVFVTSSQSDTTIDDQVIYRLTAHDLTGAIGPGGAGWATGRFAVWFGVHPTSGATNAAGQGSPLVWPVGFTRIWLRHSTVAAQAFEVAIGARSAR